MRKLTNSQISEKLTLLNDKCHQQNFWSYKQGKLIKTFKFNSFHEALSWMNDVAIFVEKLDHHPEWLNIYNKVEVKLITHEVDGLTHLDFELAEKMLELT